MSAKLTIEKMHELASAHGGKFISKKYVGLQSKHRWRCAKGHEWEALPRNVKHSGTWCPQCNNETRGSTRRFDIELMHQIAAERGGSCLSEKYINSATPLDWECEKGHQWKARPNSILRGSWCPKCAGRLGTPKERSQIMVARLRQIAIERGGRCLSTEYKGPRSRVHLECEHGHRWWADPGNVIHNGTWCPDCARKNVSISDMHALAAKKGGECLSAEYRTSQSKLRWRCALGHEWQAWPNSIQQGSWCPDCSKLVSERICRAHFESLFGKPFPTKKPKWLVNSRGNRMELDGYCESLGIAFEYQGIQHYKRHRRFHANEKDFQGRVKDDQRKAELCRQNNVHLIDVPYFVPVGELRRYIGKACKKLGIARPANWATTEINLEPAFSPDKLCEMKQLAAEHGGKLLSKYYIRDDIKLEWQCSNGHIFGCTPNHIKNGVWCSKCHHEKRVQAARQSGANAVQELAAQRGGRCLSKTYMRNMTPLTWECAKGHTWQAPPKRIKMVYWCPECARNSIKPAPIEKSLACLNPIVSEQWHPTKNEPLTPSVVWANSHKKVWWRCAKGHEWQAIIAHRYRGIGCPYCVHKRAGYGNDLATNYPGLAAEWDPEKNVGISPSDFTPGSKRKVWWRCQNGHLWKAQITDRRRGIGCPECYKLSRIVRSK